jgi:septal ring factor EnvC (AmiA/AmiB activator)
MTLVQAGIAVGSFVLSVFAFFAANRAQGRTQRLEQVRVDAEAYLRAQEIYDRTIAQLRKQNEQLIAQVDRLEQQVAKLEHAIREQGIDTTH